MLYSRTGTIDLSGDFQFAVLGLPFDAHQPVEVHTLTLQPGFQSFAGIGAKFGEHLAFEHVYEDAFGAGGTALLHALGEIFGALPRQASEGVLCEIAWHGRSSLADPDYSAGSAV